MNTWNTFAFPGPERATISLPKTRAPVPRSQRTHSCACASSCTHGESPPKVWETEKSSSLRIQARAFSGVLRSLPEAAVSARTSLFSSDAEENATGREPRVPQNLTRTDMSAGRCGLVGGKPARGDLPERLAQRTVAREYHVEPADLEDLAH